MSGVGSAGGARRRCRVGIVGFGSVGAFFVDRLLHDATCGSLELVWVWNRNAERLASLPPGLILADLATCGERPVDLIVEVCHPSVAAEYGPRFLTCADFFIGSPTVFASTEADASLRSSCAHGTESAHSIFVPAGALWGSQDLCRLADQGQLVSLEITMKKHPLSLKLEGSLEAARAAAESTEGEVVLYDGPLRALAQLAPNNVNTMAAAAIGCPCIGFDGMRGRLVSDRSLASHVIEIVAAGPTRPDGSRFRVSTVRVNPAPPGAVTGAATYNSFLASLQAAAQACMLRQAGLVPGGGVHLC